jgi:hypothetical protein
MLEVTIVNLDPILLAILGFLFGVGATLIVDAVRNRRRQIALVDLMHSEAKAFIEACKAARKHHVWASTNTRRVATLIQERYSKDPERWIACQSKKAQQAIIEFYLECSALLELMDIYEQQQECENNFPAQSIGPSNYDGIITRAEAFILLLESKSRT